MLHSKIALIPAYEPDEHLLPLVRTLSAADFSVVVVDDGSGRKYQSVFDAVSASARVLSYPDNRGKGAALKTGFRYLMETGVPQNAIIVTLDSDGQHTVSDTLKTAECAARRPDALTLGVRHFGKGTPARSRFGNAITRTAYRLSTGARVSDTQTGLRAFGAGLLPQLTEIGGSRYDYEMNVLMVCPKAGIPICEIPIETIYLNRNRASHFHTVRDSCLIYRNVFKFAASSLLGFFVDYSLYSLLTLLLAPLGAAAVPVSNVSARIVSAGVNFAVNRRFVFQSRDSVLKTGTRYFTLAACILAGNTAVLSVLVNALGVNRYAAKLLTEVTFFTFSFLVQRFVIFREGSRHSL